MRKTHCKYKDNERETEDEKVDNNFACGGNDAASGGLRRRERRKYQWRKYQQRKHRQAYPCGGSYAGSGAHLHEDRADRGQALLRVRRGSGGTGNRSRSGRTTESGTCERCGQSFGDWRIDYYVDDFNQPTDEWYITEDEYLVGTFSNSATTNSKLYANVMVDLDDNAMIFLYEYGSRQVKNSSERYWDEYNITMRTPDGADHKITGTMYCGDDRVNIDDAYIDEVLTALKGEGNVMFRIENADRTVESYLIEVATSNFAELYNAQTGQ